MSETALQSFPPEHHPTVILDSGRVVIRWPEGKRPASVLISPELLEGWAAEVNRLRDEVDSLTLAIGEAIDAGARNDAEAIGRLSRMAQPTADIPDPDIRAGQ